MLRTLGNSLAWVTLGTLLGGCGLTQTVSESTASAARAVFYKQVTTLHLDFSGRAANNTDETDMSALSVPTLVRVYQLRDSKAVEQASYDSLLSHGDSKLSADLLDAHAVVIKPGEGALLSVPMNRDAKFVTVVGLFRQPDTRMNTWRLTLARNDLEPDQPRVIELGDNRLTLRPLAKE